MPISEELKEQIQAELAAHSGGAANSADLVIENIKEYLHAQVSNKKLHPVDRVRWVSIDDVVANDYNPNSVAEKEMKLLLKSIEKDGYTQPVVVVWDEGKKKYVIVDGFHRTTIMKTYKHIQDTTNRKLPVVVLEKDMNDRMAATVRHNRARGTHSVVSMSEMVFELLDKGWSDSDIANELGMEAEEVVRLKHITGFSKLFANREYSKSWETKNQLIIKKKALTEDGEAFDA